MDKGVTVAEKDRKSKKNETEAIVPDSDAQWWSDGKDFDGWLEPEPTTDFESEDSFFESPVPPVLEMRGPKNRVERIKESYALLRQFSPKELKVLMTLKRNTSPKAWTLREDLVVLTLPMSNREIADVLHDRNKEAVKKRLQLLRSKGLIKRQTESAASES
jgi:hypothetical protein